VKMRITIWPREHENLRQTIKIFVMQKSQQTIAVRPTLKIVVLKEYHGIHTVDIFLNQVRQLSQIFAFKSKTNLKRIRIGCYIAVSQIIFSWKRIGWA